MNSHSSNSADSSKVSEQSNIKKALPVLIEEIQTLAVNQLLPAYKKAFDLVDTSFFNRAEKAGNNNEQALYFDAMRKLRLNRHLAEKSFENGLLDHFKNFPYYAEQKEYKKHAAPGELSLVQHDELEENIAFDSMTSKAHADNNEQLHHLAMRLDTLVADCHIEPGNTLLAPTRIVDILMLSVSALELDITCKLILYKQFDLTVMSVLNTLLRQSNRILIEAGILPDLRFKVSKNEDETRVKQLTEALASNLTELSQLSPPPFETNFAELQGLLSAARNLGYVAPRSAITGTYVAPDDVLTLLDGLQAKFALQQASDVPLEEWLTGQASVIKPSSIRLSLLEALALRGENQAKALDQDNEDVINLVEMLFELVLNDNYIPSTIQAMISRLQIPIIKIALKDKEFFNRPTHPARKLLNELTRASVGWSASDEGSKDELLERIYTIVQAIVAAEHPDADLFEKHFMSFREYIEKEGKRVKLTERRTREYEVGIAKVKLVKEKVASTLDECIGDQSVPQVVHELLFNAWSKVLYTIYLNEGDHSEKWAHAIQAAKELIWSVQPVTDTSSQAQWLKQLPPLLKNINEGLTEISYDPFEINSLFSRLERVHVNLFKTQNRIESVESNNAQHYSQSAYVVEENGGDSLDAWIKQASETSQPNKQQSNASTENIDLETQTMLDGLSQQEESASDSKRYFVSTNLDKKETPVTDTPDVEESSETIELYAMDDITDDSSKAKSGIERQKIRSRSIALEYQQKVQALTPETWLMFYDEQRNEIRCKLIEKINETKELVFVNRRGQKVFVKTFNSVADELRKGDAVIIDGSMASGNSLFDRAFGRLLGMLKSDVKKQEEQQAV